MATEARPCPTDGEMTKARRPLVEEEGDLRQKNQVTIPRQVVRLLGLRPGDRLIFEVSAELDLVDAARGEKYVDPGSGARDTIRG